MRRWLFVWAAGIALVASSLIAAASLSAEKSGSKGTRTAQNPGPHTITVTPWGPDQETIDETKQRVEKNPRVQFYLKGKRYRMISFDFVESAVKQENPEPPSRYRATFFDYTSNRVILAEGKFTESTVDVSLSTVQPNPSPEEFDAAVAIVANDPKLGPGIRDGSVETYPAMPPLVNIDSPTNRVERTLSVGLLKNDGGNEIVGVNMIRQAVIRYDGGAPPTSSGPALNCGVPSAGQGTTSRGTAGQFTVTISRNGEEFWNFTVIRPSASSATNASGVELVNVKYRTKLVLARANVPILNVQYYRNLCGPFRDWSWQEGMFVANGTDVAPGIRMCTDEPQTMIDNGTDTGNFRGVAIYDREEVTLVSELNAGWYRYISKWIFHDDGVISPRFGFGATTNSCVCNGHIHHVYWRFDFDILGPASNIISEFNQGALKAVDTESMRPRLGGEQYWEVKNALSPTSVIIRPGELDGNYDKYGGGDLWLLRTHPGVEMDDNGLGSGTNAHLNPMLNGENIFGQDVVVWYAGHWNHDHFDRPIGAGPNHGDGPTVCGPDLILQGY